MKCKALFVVPIVFFAMALSCSFAQSQQFVAAQSELTTLHDFPADATTGLSHTDLALYAWRLFIAANQGTNATIYSGAGRETPTTSFIDAGRNPLFNNGSNPLIFEGLYHRTEAYPYFTGTAPRSPINQQPVYYTYSKNGSTIVPFTVKYGQYVNLDETNQIGQNFLYYRKSGDPNFPVLYMAKVNSVEVNYAYNRTLAPSQSASWVFPSGVLEIKAAWRRVSDITNSNPQNYHQAQATYYVGEEGTGNPTIETDKFALIALHIIQKMQNFPQFIFTTFEHVDAVTRDNHGTILDPAYELTYQNLAYGSGDPATATPKGAYTENAVGQSGGTDAVATYNLPLAGPQPAGYQVVSQPKTITTEVNDVNNAIYAAIINADPNSIWKYYRLKGVQAVPTSDETELDYYLANIVVESSQPGIQLFRGTVGGTGTANFTNNRLPGNVSEGLTYNQPVPQPKYSVGGCMGCHGVAQQFGGDFSFLAAKAGTGKQVDSVPPGDLTAAQLAKHNKAVSARRVSGFFQFKKK